MTSLTVWNVWAAAVRSVSNLLLQKGSFSDTSQTSLPHLLPLFSINGGVVVQTDSLLAPWQDLSACVPPAAPVLEDKKPKPRSWAAGWGGAQAALGVCCDLHMPCSLPPPPDHPAVAAPSLTCFAQLRTEKPKSPRHRERIEKTNLESLSPAHSCPKCVPLGSTQLQDQPQHPTVLLACQLYHSTMPEPHSCKGLLVLGRQKLCGCMAGEEGRGMLQLP